MSGHSKKAYKEVIGPRGYMVNVWHHNLRAWRWTYHMCPICALAWKINCIFYNIAALLFQLCSSYVYRKKGQLWGRRCLPLGTHWMPFSDPRHSWTWELVEASNSWLPILLLVVYTNWNLTYTTRQGRRVSCLAQTCFAAFGKGVQLISGSPYAETEQLSRLTSPSGILATSGWSVTAWI